MEKKTTKISWSFSQHATLLESARLPVFSKRRCCSRLPPLGSAAYKLARKDATNISISVTSAIRESQRLQRDQMGTDQYLIPALVVYCAAVVLNGLLVWWNGRWWAAHAVPQRTSPSRQMVAATEAAAAIAVAEGTEGGALHHCHCVNIHPPSALFRGICMHLVRLEESISAKVKLGRGVICTGISRRSYPATFSSSPSREERTDPARCL